MDKREESVDAILEAYNNESEMYKQAIIEGNEMNIKHHLKRMKELDEKLAKLRVES